MRSSTYRATFNDAANFPLSSLSYSNPRNFEQTVRELEKRKQVVYETNLPGFSEFKLDNQISREMQK